MDNDFGIKRFIKGSRIESDNLNNMTEGVRASTIYRNHSSLMRRNSSGQTSTPIIRKPKISGSGRFWVVITEIISPSEYIGKILEGPYNSTEIELNIVVRVPGAEANELELDRGYFADKSKDAEGEAIYLIDGHILG